MPPGAVLYLRVSSADQVKNLSLDTQERLCRDYCEREGWRVVRVFRDEGESAKTTDRTALQELRAFAKRVTGILYVVMYDDAADEIEGRAEEIEKTAQTVPNETEVA